MKPKGPAATRLYAEMPPVHTNKEKAMRSLMLSAVVGLSSLGLLLTGPSAARAAEAPARLHVLLPADATLTVDGRPTRSITSDRWFVSPPLQEGRDFHYDLRAQFLRGGEVVTVERTVTIRAGEETTIRLGLPETAAPAAFEEGRPGVVSQSFYYSPETEQTGAVSRSFYYPSVEVRPPTAPSVEIQPLPADVGGARDNWKPDTSDPFYPWY
jgi:uncharacterized protein (TIGR03000 family)